jgi:hypothetical protein
MNKKDVVLEAVIGFLLWTIFLTPYVLLITQMTTTQYLSWILMQLILVTPLAPIVFRITKVMLQCVEKKEAKPR